MRAGEQHRAALQPGRQRQLVELVELVPVERGRVLRGELPTVSDRHASA
jgi:hypothetical protein